MPATYGKKSHRSPSVDRASEASTVSPCFQWKDGRFGVWDGGASDGGKVSESKAYVGDSLGLRLYDTEAVIARLKQGLSVASFERLSEVMGIAPLRLAAAANIATRTLARRKTAGRLPFSESERVFRLAVLFDRAVDALGDAERARRWFQSPLKALGGRSPLDYADTEIGAREVEDLLGRIEYGVFS